MERKEILDKPSMYIFTQTKGEIGMENKMEKVSKPRQAKEEKVYTTKEMALALGMNGKQLRRKLRAMEKYNDGIYTRYAWTKTQYDAIVKQIKAGGKKEEAKA